MRESKTKVVMTIAFVCWGIAAVLTAVIMYWKKEFIGIFMGHYQGIEEVQFAIPISMVAHLVEVILMFIIFKSVSSNVTIHNKKTVSVIFIVAQCLALPITGLLSRIIQIQVFNTISSNEISTYLYLDSVTNSVAGLVLNIANMLFFVALGTYMCADNRVDQPIL